MIIQEIKGIGKKQERFYVIMSSGEKYVLHGLTIIKSKLKVGDEIDCEELENYQFEYEKITAFDKCIDLLSKGMKTKKQIKEYLQSKGYLPRVIQYVLDKLQEYKYIDDATYTDVFVKTYSKQKGKRALAYELKLKGVKQEIIDNCLKDLEDQSQIILDLAKKYLRSKPCNYATKTKLFRHLLSKGFSYDEITNVIDQNFDFEE